VTTLDTEPPSAGREQQLAEALVMLADTLADDYDVVEFMDRLLERCVVMLGATAAGLLLLDQRGDLAVVASSSEETRLLEVFQLQGDEGPCLDCIHTSTTVTAADLAADTARWPRFVPAALATGFRAVDAVPMRLRTLTIGGLNLFHAEPRALAAADLRIAQALADVATIGILQQRVIHRSSMLAEQLQLALNSRVVIEQAKGLLAERHGVSFDRAFAELRGHARNHNLKLSDVALAVTRGQLVLPDPD
jgi:ANTAR domain/GAF domain